jgi:flagellar biosynthesis/type III secretory pathway chaperone
MNQLIDLLKSQITILEDLIRNTIFELSNFNKFSPEELFRIAGEKEELMKNLIFVRAEIDTLINRNSELNLKEIEYLFKNIDNLANQMKEENKKLMILTLSMKQLYDDLVENVDNKTILNIDI